MPAQHRRPAQGSEPLAARRIDEFERRLRAAYGQPRHHNPTDPLDDLIFIVLSRMTQEVKYVRTYAALRSTYPTWGAVRDAPQRDLVSLLSDAGLAHTKARDIQALLDEIERREGDLDLTGLQEVDDEDVERYLMSLPGVSLKTARCVMLYTLGRQALPVDAHVWRVAGRLGLAPQQPWSERESRRLEERTPAALRVSLHLTLLAHGRAICTARTPRCHGCVLADLCPSSRSNPPTAGAQVSTGRARRRAGTS